MAQTACSDCVAGKYKSSNSCIDCSCTGQGEVYAYCPAGSIRQQCKPCTGTVAGSYCPAGQEPSQICDGTQQQDISCVNCPAGKHKPVQNQIRCDLCPDGKYKDTASTTDCQPCTNKNSFLYPLGAVYDAWPSGYLRDTNNCPWSCIAGYYSTGAYCDKCNALAGKWSNARQSVCSACTNKPANSVYAIASQVGATFDGASDNCPWICNIGYQKYDYLSQGFQCRPCSAFGDYYTPAVTGAFPIYTCTPRTTCKSTEFEPAGLTYTGAQDRTCTACRTVCPAGQRITAACSARADLQCTPCATQCGMNQYLSGATCDGTTWDDTVLRGCLPCQTVTDCKPGVTYHPGNCTGTEISQKLCVLCQRIQCNAGYWSGGCGGFSPTQCIKYTTCPAGQYLSGTGESNDGVCQACRDCAAIGRAVATPCGGQRNTGCSGDSCNATSGCDSTNNTMRYCNYVEDTGQGALCGVCPMGYQSNGQFCIECPEGKTCSRRGDVACQGQCDAGVRSMCDPEIGYANCEQGGCGSGVAVANGVVYRGSYENPVQSGDCVTYFRCNVGYYKWFSSYATTGCLPCSGKHVLARYVSGGLSPSDNSSCLWECDATSQKTTWQNGSRTCAYNGALEALAIHPVGWYGSEGATAFAPKSCQPMYTTEVNTALRVTDCLACPDLYPNAKAVAAGRSCEWECNAGYTSRGERCVWEPVNGQACDLPGWTKDDEGKCVRTTVPWNRPGYLKTATRVRVASVLTGGGGGAAAQGPNATLVASSAAGGVSGRHTVRIQGESGAWNTATTEGPLCSMTRVWTGGRQYVVGAVCNQSFLVFLSIADVGLNSSMPTRLGWLIGQPGNPGWADGFKTQARFGVELYVTSGLESQRVWVLDRWNCLVREVVVWRTPGDYRTRVYTVHGLTDKFALTPPQAKCYGPGSLAEPRRFWEISGAKGGPSGLVLFSDDNGLWQLDLARATLTPVMGEGWDLGRRFEADELVSVVAPDVFTLILGFRDGSVWTVVASEEECPDDWTSYAGSDCVVGCSWNGGSTGGAYVNATSGACVPCAMSSGCKAGQRWQPCTRRAQAQCVSCPAIASALDRRSYVIAGDCDVNRMRFTPPCPPGFYAANNTVPNGGVPVYCDLCPGEGMSTTELAGATRVEQCKCTAGLRRSQGARSPCKGEALYSYDDGVCVSSPAQCLVPPRAALVSDWGDGFGRCGWECNAGFYRATGLAWVDSCQACTRVGNELQRVPATRGDDDSPLSCEFFP